MDEVAVVSEEVNEEINKIIDSLEGCIGMFDYMITPIESNLLVSYIRELQQKYLNAVADYETTMAEKKELENQQKEVIDYLEYQVKLQEELNDIHLATGFGEILSKFKEIIGGIK